MSKDKLTDYDATAGNNTDVGGITIDEGMLPSNVNNAIREVMSHLKDFAAGTEAVDAIEVTGDLTVDTDTLYVDSTNNEVGIGTTSPSSKTSIIGTGVNGLHLGQQTDNNANSSRLFYDNSTNIWTTYSTAGSFKIASGATIGTASGTDRMVIDSSGNVGIGSSPTQNFDVVSSGASVSAVARTTSTGDTNVSFRIQDGTTGTGSGSGLYLGRASAINYLWTYENEPWVFATNNTERMRIRDDGRVAINNTGASTVQLYVKKTVTTGYNGYFQNTSASDTGSALLSQTQRSASSGFTIYEGYSLGDREFHLRGDGRAYADISWNGGGADYAEYFEWDDDNTNNEDRRGYSVVLTNGNKIRKATSGDAAADIIGVISGNPSVVGDAAWNKWVGKYNRDDFNSYITESYTVTEWTDADGTEHSYETDKIPSDVTAPADATVLTQDGDGNALKRRQLNSSYDDTQTYTPREDRQEWDAVGMMGKLRLRAGQPTGDRWIKMRDIATDDDGNVTVEEWLVR